MKIGETDEKQKRKPFLSIANDGFYIAGWMNEVGVIEIEENGKLSSGDVIEVPHDCEITTETGVFAKVRCRLAKIRRIVIRLGRGRGKNVNI